MAEQQLGALITALQAQKTELPSTVLQAMEGIVHSSAGAEAKEHHRAVKQQTKAKQELAKVRAQRHACMNAWAQYLKDVTATVTRQMAEQQSTVQSLDEAEAQWTEALKTANSELNRFSAVKLEDAPAEMAEEAMMETPMALDAINKKRKALESEQQEKLLASLHAASQTADSMVQAARREGSRTPRRQRTAQDTMDIHSSPELAPAGMVKEPPPPHELPPAEPAVQEGTAAGSRPFAKACG